MKKAIIVLFANIILTGALVSSCDTRPERDQAETVPEARDDRQAETEARQDMSETANLEEDYQEFRNEADERIARLEQNISEMRESDQGLSDENQERIADMESELNELRREIEEYRVTTEDGWDTFRTDYNTRLRNLEQSVGDIGGGDAGSGMQDDNNAGQGNDMDSQDNVDAQENEDGSQNNY